MCYDKDTGINDQMNRGGIAMKMTSAQANKMLRQLSEELDALESQDSATRTFLAATVENLEAVRPAYDYAALQEKYAELEGRIRTIKHAMNLFNTSTVVPGFDMTIDAMLVYLPQLSHRKAQLARMKSTLPMERQTGRSSSSLIEYRYANYDIAQAAADFDRVSGLLARAQNALDLVNSTVEFEVDI